MEPRFKVGDIVRIKQLSELPFVPPYKISEAMYQLSGKEARITQVVPNTYHRDAFKDIPSYMLDEAKYIIDIDRGCWKWSLPMLSKVPSTVNIRVTKKSIKFNFNN